MFQHQFITHQQRILQGTENGKSYRKLFILKSELSQIKYLIKREF